MRPRILWQLPALALLAPGFGGPAWALDVEPAPAQWKAQAFPACSGGECSFEDRTGANRYALSAGTLTRSSRGSEVYRLPLTGRSEKALLAGISGARNQLVVVIARERMSIRGRSGFTTADIHPKDVEREHRLVILNPKSGDTVKFIDLGAFRPQELALSEYGEQVLLCGLDLRLRTREIRIYNARSGKLEHDRRVEHPADEVVLAADGYEVAGEAWRLAAPGPETIRRFSSRDPYSIAEYRVECTGLLGGARYEAGKLAVLKFEGADYEVGQMLANGLTLKLRSAGFTLVERQRIEEIADEQYLQTTGFTAEEEAVEIGRAANAHYLALGSLRQAGTTSALAVRLVGVEDGAVVDGCEATCWECRPDDYHEALSNLVATWIGR
jgi:hypothetical protein